MKVVKGGRSEKKGGESKKESLVKSSMFMLCLCLCLCLVMVMGMDMEVGKCRHMSSLIKSRGVKCGHLIRSVEGRGQVLISLGKMVPPGFDPGTLTTSR